MAKEDFIVKSVLEDVIRIVSETVENELDRQRFFEELVTYIKESYEIDPTDLNGNEEFLEIAESIESDEDFDIEEEEDF